jgi:hypothetical protein
MKDNVFDMDKFFNLTKKGKKRSRSPNRIIFNKKNKKNKIDKDEFNIDGFDKDGFDKDGFDKDGFNIDGFNIDGFDKDGFNKDGFDKDGFDKDEFNIDGFNKDGFDKDGFNIDGFDKDGFNIDGFNIDGFDEYGFDEYGFDIDGLDEKGYNIEGFDKDGFDEYGFNINGFDEKGYNIKGFDEKGYDIKGYDKDGYDIDGFDIYGFDIYGFDETGYNIDGHEYGFNIKGYEEEEEEEETEEEDDDETEEEEETEEKDEDKKKPKISLILLLDALTGQNNNYPNIPPMGVTGKKIRFNKKIKNKKKIKKIVKSKIPSKPKTYVRIQREINGIEDLIELGKMYDPIKAETEKYNIDLYRLNELVEPLTELKNMIGLDDAKKYLVNQIVYYLQDFEENSLDMMHTVIEGSPGVGKTTFAKILSKIFLKMGILENDKFITARRSDLIGGYLGQTAMKTQDVIDSANGGVLFIDEVYSLGHPEKRDSFSKECIDVLNQNLTENKSNFICIIAGYKEDNKKNFFAMNPGLERRFPWRVSMSDYEAPELRKIFVKMVLDKKWDVEGIKVDFFEKNKCYFKFNGGDMETLFQMCRIVHSRRVFCLDLEHKKKLTMIDLENGLKMFLGNEEIKKRKDDDLINVMSRGLYI